MFGNIIAGDGIRRILPARRMKCPSVAVGICAALLSVRPAGAEPATGSAPRFDGVWIIDASVASQLCPRHSRRLFIAVLEGKVVRIAGLTDPPPKAWGAVEPGGGVTLSISAYGYTATVSGTLGGGSGAGGWTSDSSLCAKGAWRAIKAN